MKTEPNYIWMNGELVEFKNAKIHFLASALHYGTGVFEGIRCYDTPQGPAIFRLTDHLDRLFKSAKILGFIEMPFTADQLCEATKKVVLENKFKECYIRPLIYHSGKLPSMILTNDYVGVGIAAWDLGAYLGEEAMENGIRANISSFTRHHPNIMMTKAKTTGNYVNSALARTESIRLGFEEGIMLDPQGFVAECTGENIFIVRNNRIFTPPKSTILEGITRESLITIATDLGYQVIEEPISRDQLYVSDEIFVCGTAAECIAIREIDFRPIGSGKMGTITREIQKVYWSAIHGKHPDYERWLYFIKTNIN